MMVQLSSFRFMFLASYYKLLLCVLLFCWLYTYLIINGRCRETFPSLTKAKDRFFACVQKSAEIYQDNAKNFLFDCIKTYTSIDELFIDKKENNVSDEKLMIIPLSKNFPQEKCIWLTIGIGGSTTTEQHFHKKHPKCKIYGTDPTNVGNFADFGTVIPHTVGFEKTDAHFPLMVKQKANKYENKKASVLSLTNILDQFVHSRLIHYLNIGIAGDEHIKPQEFVGNGILTKQNITFCQIVAELQNFNKNTSVNFSNPVKFTLNFLKDNSPYIPLFNLPTTPKTRQKVTLINVYDRRCEKAFKFRSLFLKT